ncbi:hypothetical protein [Actinomyces oris]
MTSQDWASWIGAIGTAGATLIATITLALEAWWRRSDKRKEQAVRITVWVLTNQKSDQKTDDVIRISNQSFSPVYRFVVTVVINEQNGSHYPAWYRRIFTALPPGEWQLTAPKGWRRMSARPGVEIAFTDAHGVHWLRNAVGHLHERPIDAIKHYGVELPYSPDQLTPATT